MQVHENKNEMDGSIDLMINMGPQHPSTHGVLRLKIHTDGEIVSKIEPVLGYLHRCFEKHCEYHEMGSQQFHWQNNTPGFIAQ